MRFTGRARRAQPRNKEFSMWNRRKDEEGLPKPAASPTHGSQPTTPPPVPSSNMPMRSYEQPVSSGGAATIGKAVAIRGQIFSREDLVIDGEVEGTVEAAEHRVTVGPNGKVQAGIKAREIVVLGAIHGNVEAVEKIDIRKDARLVGDIKTARIVIEDGAYFKGSIDITKTEPKPAARPVERKEPQQPLPQAAAPTAASGQ
ncbi:MAG TPA: polymer-forming cytoskeletal protein [Bryobacteraceae bacterium]|nr:polymer-forming cytoskeletal protein [Bryobacteraceae bacterium]